MAKIQMVLKIIIVAVLISVSLTEEIANSTSQISDSSKSINQSIQTTKQATSQLIASNDNNNNASISTAISNKVTDDVQESQSKKVSHVQENNLTSTIQNGNQVQNVENDPKKISENDQNTNKKEEVLPGNLTLEVLNQKQEKVNQIDEDSKIKNKIVLDSVNVRLSNSNEQQSNQSNIDVSILNIVSSKQNQPLSLKDGALMQISSQLLIKDKNDSSSVAAKDISSQVQTLVNNNQTDTKQINAEKADEQPVQKNADSTIVISENIDNSLQNPISSSQTETNKSQSLSIGSQQEPKQPALSLTSDIKDIDSIIVPTNLTITSDKETNIKANQASQESKNYPSIDAITNETKSQTKQAERESIRQIKQVNETKNVIVLENTSLLNQKQNQGTANNIANIDESLAQINTISQISKNTENQQKQQETDNNTQIASNSQQKKENASNNILVQTDSSSKGQVTSILTPSDLTQAQNSTQPPIQAITDQTANKSQQKSQKQLEKTNETVIAQSNITEVVLFQGKLPQEVKIDPQQVKKIEEVDQILKQNKQQGQTEGEIVDQFKLKTDFESPTNNTDSSTILPNEEINKAKSVVKTENIQDVENSQAENKNQSVIETKDVENIENSTSKVIGGDQSSQQNNKQSNIALEEILANQTTIQKQTTQISSIAVNTNTQSQKQISNETKIVIQNQKIVNNVSDSTSPPQTVKDENTKDTSKDDIISTSSNTKQTSNTTVVQTTDEINQQPSQTKKQQVKEVKPFDDSIIGKQINSTSSSSQTPISIQKAKGQSTKQDETGLDKIIPEVKQKFDLVQSSKAHELSHQIEQNNEQSAIVKPKKQQKSKQIIEKQTKTITKQKTTKKQQEKNIKKEEVNYKKPQKKYDQQETPSLNIFDFKQPNIKEEKVIENKQESKQKTKNTLAPKKPFKLHAQQLNNQRAAKKKQQENSKQSLKIDLFNKENNQLIQQLAKQKKVLEKKLTQNKPKETPIIIQKKQKPISQKQPSFDNEIYVIAIFMIIGVLVIHFLIKAFCGSKKKQATKSQSAQNLGEEDEDFDLSCPDMAERLEEDY